MLKMKHGGKKCPTFDARCSSSFPAIAGSARQPPKVGYCMFYTVVDNPSSHTFLLGKLQF